MDWPDAPKVAERLRSMVPPHILDPGPLPPQVAAMIQKMQNAYQELQKAVDTDAVKAASNERIKKAEMEAKIRIAAMENLVRLMQTEAKINADRAIQLTQAEIDRAQAMLEALATPPVEEAAPPVPPPGIAPPGPEAAPPAPADVAPTMQ
jgi:lysyl-tRNA synthetase class I